MAISFTVSYSFSPNTTISSSQVNTNFSDNAAVWTGLEALTKTFAKLKVDVDPTTALEVATKQYVDHYSTYRRPVLQYNSSTVVNVETGLNGTSGLLKIQFPDGTTRTDSTTGRIQCNTAQVASLTGTAQSGVRTGSSASNTWYATYAVESQVNSTDIVIVADTTLPLQANLANLNTFFGSNAWVYLGLFRIGDRSGATGVILQFVQSGNLFKFDQVTSGNSTNSSGILMATTASATSLTYSYAAGTGSAQIPANISHAYYGGFMNGITSGNNTAFLSAAATTTYLMGSGFPLFGGTIFRPATDGMKIQNSGGVSSAIDIYLEGFVDGVLGVGSNPLL